MTEALDAPLRSAEQALAELQEKFDRLPLTDRRRAELARMIRQLETWIAGEGRL